MPKIYVDSSDENLKNELDLIFGKYNLQIAKRISSNIDFYIVDFETSKYIDIIPKEKILIYFIDFDNKKKLAHEWDKNIIYKPVEVFEFQKIDKIISENISHKTDIISAVYVTSKQFEKINNDFRERINDLSDDISKSYIIDSQFFLDELIKIIIDYLSDLLKAKRVSIMFLDKEKQNDLLYNIDITDTKVYKKLYCMERGEITKDIIKKGKSVLVNNIKETKFKGYLNKIKRYNTNSFLSVPLKFKKDIVAIIYVTEKIDENFTTKDLNIVEIIASSMERFFNEKIYKFNELLRLGISKEKKTYDTIKLKEDLSNTIVLLKKTQDELQDKSKELNVLYNVNNFVKNTFVVEELLKMIVDTIIISMKVNRASVLLVSHHKDMDDILVSGVIGKKGNKVDNLKISDRGKVSTYLIENKETIIHARNQHNVDLKWKYSKNYATDSFISVPVKIKNHVVAIINVTDKEDGSDFNDNDKKVLEILANQTAISIENFNLSSQLIESEKTTHELNIARDIQMKLMPTEKINNPDFEIDFMCIPAKEVGGDYIDFIDIDENNKGIVIGDVSGKSVPAALLMVMLRTLIRSFAGRELSPAAVVEKVNNLLVKDIDPKVFATLFYGIYNRKRKTLRFCNAGHNFPQIVRNGEIITELSTGDVVLGFFENYIYHEDTIKLNKNDILYLYTDGVIEAQHLSGKIYGNERFNKIIENTDIKKVFDVLLKDIRKYTGTESFSDDLTFSYFKVKK